MMFCEPRVLNILSTSPLLSETQGAQKPRRTNCVVITVLETKKKTQNIIANTVFLKCELIMTVTSDPTL